MRHAKTPASKRPLREHARDTLRARIVAGDYPPGTRLIERDLADELGVSRLPVREALRMLCQEGMVSERSSARGMVVSSLAPDQVSDLFDVRESLETLACQLAARRTTPADLESLKSLVDDARQALQQGAVCDVWDANAAFHDTIIAFAGNEFLRSALEPLQDRMHWLMRRARNLPELIDEHEELCAAIASGDPGKAAARSVSHIQKYRQQYHNSQTDGVN